MSTTLNCTVTGLTNGRPYRFSVRALNGSGWGPWSAWSAPVTPERSTPSITITGTRKGRTVVVEGQTQGLVDEQVRAMLKFPGQPEYRPGSLRRVDDEGRFTWQRRTGKKTYVYFTHADLRSNRVVIR